MHGVSLFIKSAIVLLSTILLTVNSSLATAELKGQFIGSVETDYPDWFKNSFLELPDDIQEATKEHKRLMLIFYQDGCPYCNALIERNFSQKNIVDKTKAHFDVIAINIWGDREIIDTTGREYTEKTYAAALKVQFTPTVVFFDEQANIILRINGYHDPQRCNLELDYVTQHKEKTISYRDYMLANLPEKGSSKRLNEEDFFSKNGHDYSKKNARPFIVFFEQKDCPDCDFLHSEILPDQRLLEIITQFENTQLDMWSKTPLITPEGERTTARDWARELGINYAPTLVIFNREGNEIIRSEAFFKVFHTMSMFQYVLGRDYENQPNFQRYLSEYADQLRERGINVNLWKASESNAVSK